MDESSAVVEPIIKDVVDGSCDQAELTRKTVCFSSLLRLNRIQQISVDEHQIIAHLHGLDKSKLHRIHKQLVAEKTDVVHWNHLLNKNTYKYFARKKVSFELLSKVRKCQF